MLGTIRGTVVRDDDFPERTWVLDCRSRMRDGTLYDVLPHEYYEETNLAGEYIPVSSRRPSVRSNLAKIVVDESGSFLFGEGRFPAVTCEDEPTRDALRDMIADSNLGAAMHLAAHVGSVGSVVMLMRVLAGRVYWDAMPTAYLTPQFDQYAPDVLIQLTEKRKVKGVELRGLGYTIDDNDLRQDFWWQRVWDLQAETWYMPWLVRDDKAKAVVDDKRTTLHKLGFLPAVWIRNLPGGVGIDGACTFDAAAHTVVEIDYLMSQGGRGLKYSCEPLLVIRDGGSNIPIIRSASQALLLSGDAAEAKLLEISGNATAAVLEQVRALRDMALEAMHGYRGTPERVSTATSGRALEMLYHPSVAQADRLRSSYGDAGVLRLLDMVRRAAAKVVLRFRDGRIVPPLSTKQPLGLRWPKWFPPGEDDKQLQGSTVSGLSAAGLMSRETGLGVIASDYDIEDVPAELLRIAADEVAADKREIAKAAQVKVNESTPG